MLWQDFGLDEAMCMLEELRDNLPQKSEFTENDFSEFLDFVKDLLWESGLE